MEHFFEGKDPLRLWPVNSEEKIFSNSMEKLVSFFVYFSISFEKLRSKLRF